MASAALSAPQLLRPAAIARQLGVSRQSISELIARGVIPKNADGLVDVELARIAISNRVRPSSKTSQALTVIPPASTTTEQAPISDTMSYHVAKTLREAAEAKIAQYKLAELQGDLVRLAVVRTAVAKLAAGLREGLMQIPSRLAPVLAAETDAAAVHDHIAAELRQVLEQVTAADIAMPTPPRE